MTGTVPPPPPRRRTTPVYPPPEGRPEEIADRMLGIEERETLRSRRRSVRTLFEVRGRVTLVWALISLALGLGAYIFVSSLVR